MLNVVLNKVENPENVLFRSLFCMSGFLNEFRNMKPGQIVVHLEQECKRKKQEYHRAVFTPSNNETGLPHKDG